MTVLQELAALYDRRADAAGWPRPGFSTERIGAEVVLAADGSVAAIRSLMAPDRPNGKGKIQARPMSVPAPPGDRRGMKLVSGRFWDPMPYALGVVGKPEQWSTTEDRTAHKFEAFKQFHLEMLDGEEDAALRAMRLYCENWSPERFADFPGAAQLLGTNVVFRLSDGPFLHDLPAARHLLFVPNAGGAMCLLTGRIAPVARLHMPIKVPFHDKQPPFVSFNERAFESHGKSQGDNAPVSESAAFAYGTALNALLAKGSGNSLRIGDATVAFWARGGGEGAAENALAAALGMDMRAQAAGDETRDERILRDSLVAVAQGKAPAGTALDPAARVFVLGLAPNAARLSVRFWYPGTLGHFARHVVQFWDECAITPSPFARDNVELPPKPWALLYDLAAQRDDKNIPNGMGGDLMRAILTGGRYPTTLLSAIIGRLRVEGEPEPKDRQMDGRRAAMLRAVLIRNFSREVPMALDEDATDVAYLLGRLFGAYAYGERSYQARGAGLRQKYMGAASATPARVFPVLMRGYEHNLASLLKAGGQKAGSGVRADRAVTAIIAGLPGDGALPATLPLEEQGRFFIGFYHQTAAFFAKAEDAADMLVETEGETTE